MLLVMLLCIFVARLIVDHKSADAVEGAAVLAEIQRKGLHAYLPAARCEDFYIITAGSEPTGWKFIYVQPNKNGGYEGGCVMLRQAAPDSTEISVSRWELDKNAAAGKYFSQVFIKGALPQEIYTTEIVLKNGKISLSQSLGGKAIEATSKRPANYIPEDLMQAAMFRLAKKKKNACFTTIYDIIPSDNSSIPFITLKCQYDGVQDGLTRLAVRSSLDSSSTEDSIFFFDGDGKTVKIISPTGEIESLTNREKLGKIFPNSADLIKTLME